MPKLSYKERARLRREQEILRTAARMIRDYGYINLNMDDLAEEVGISKPTLYQHFKGKDDMVAKTMIQTMLEMEQYIKDLQTENAIDGLMQILRYMLNGQADPERFSLSIVQDAATTLHHLIGDNLEMREIMIRIKQQMYSLIDTAKQEGSIRSELPHLVVLSTMFSLLDVLKGPDVIHDWSVGTEEIINLVPEMFRRSVAP
ncbi:MAG: TetR/AcrR family transcriptional regulator [Chloroflexota bacterium]